MKDQNVRVKYLSFSLHLTNRVSKQNKDIDQRNYDNEQDLWII